jgi:hypothetical protein
MKSIGGYFEIELKKLKPYHNGLIELNSGRGAFEYLLRSKGYKKVILPFYTCDVLLDVVKMLGINHEFYEINENLEPRYDLSLIGASECFVYTNYFGIKDEYIEEKLKDTKNLIIDNAQSFFSKPLKNIDTFYSPRKFLGVSDGGYLYSQPNEKLKLVKDVSFDRFSHLLKRLDLSAEEGFSDSKLNEKKIDKLPLSEMSNLTKKMLSSIDYVQIGRTRVSNFKILHKYLGNKNKLKFHISENQIPMVYPYWRDDENLKTKLLNHKIYCATYWPNVLDWVKIDSLEYDLTNKLVCLPIDQRYDENDMKFILNAILN